MCVLILPSYTSIWSYTKMLFVIQKCVKNLLRERWERPNLQKDSRENQSHCFDEQAFFCKGMKSLIRGKSASHALT